MNEKSKIVAELPSSSLDPLNTKNVIWVDVHLYGKRRGWLQLSKGGVEWWPGNRKVRVYAGNWETFARALEETLRERRRPPKKSNRRTTG